MSFLYPDKHYDGPNTPYIPPNSPEGQERARWDRPKSQGGMRCNGFESYPKTLYKAGRPDHANVKITESITVRSEGEESVMFGQGWRPSQEDAIALVHAEHRDHATLAAERHYAESRMSEAAQREAAAVDASTIYHVPVIPETPIRKRPGRKPKAQVTA